MPDKNKKTILQKVIKIVFKQGQAFGGLQLCSQTILCDFLKEYESNEAMQEYVFKDKRTIVQSMLQNYATELQSGNKQDVYEKIQRFMPFDNFEFLQLSKLKKCLDDVMKTPPQTAVVFLPSKMAFNQPTNPVHHNSSAEFTKPQTPPKFAEAHRASVTPEPHGLSSEIHGHEETTNSVLS